MAPTKLVILSMLAALATAAPNTLVAEQRQSALTHQLPLRDGVCDICTNAITSAEEYISDPETEANLAKILDEQICDNLPETMVNTCKLEVPMLVSVLITMMKQSVPPVTICQYMGMCDQAHSWTDVVKANGLAGLPSPFDCPMCKLVVERAVQQFLNSPFRAELEKQLNAACGTMDAEAQPRCHADVASLFRDLDNLLHDVDPSSVCHLTLFCSSGAGMTAPRAAPVALSELAAALRHLAALPATSAAGNGLFDTCESCKAIITEASAIIQDPTTQREILDYAKQGCSVFADYKPQCEAYVDLYGPLLLSMALQYLQPDVLCERMGYCPVAALMQV